LREDRGGQYGDHHVDRPHDARGAEAHVAETKQLQLETAWVDELLVIEA
jgi:hypothetical protein